MNLGAPAPLAKIRLVVCTVRMMPLLVQEGKLKVVEFTWVPVLVTKNRLPIGYMILNNLFLV